MAVKATGESMNREFRNENDEVIVSSSTNVGINTIGSMTLTLLDAQKIKDSETIVEELKALIDDVLAMSAKYLNQKAGVMEVLIHDTLYFIRDIIDYWPAIISASGIVALGYRKLNKRQDERDKAQEEQLLVMRQEIKRIEFMQAVTLDYGLQIVGSIFDEYEEMGGNHYLHSVYEKYKKEKEEK